MMFEFNGRRPVAVSSLKEASDIYCAARDKSGFGSSRMRDGVIRNEAGQFVARVSYNGRVWGSECWHSGDVPLTV